MIGEYFPILLFIVVGVAMGLVLPLAGAILSRTFKSQTRTAQNYLLMNVALMRLKMREQSSTFVTIL